MRTIEFDDPHRRKHFDFFRRLDQPHFSATASVEISPLLSYIKDKEIAFTPALVYCVTRVGNSLPAFRQRIRGDAVVEHDIVHPSLTVLTDVSSVFSFCHMHYQPGFSAFVADARRRMERMKTEPSFEDEEGRDDYLYLSAIPWVSFTSISHAMHYSPPDSMPRIAWGKYVADGDRISMPLSVQAHHALVDGRDMGRYFEAIEELVQHPEELA